VHLPKFDRATILAIARECCGTPYHHQGRVPGVGLDSIGLVIVIGRALRLPYSLKTRYTRRPHAFGLQEEMDGLMTRRDGRAPGAVGVFSNDSTKRPAHLAIYTEETGIIHALPRLGIVECNAVPDSLTCLQVYDYPGVMEACRLYS
jgi:hypothetical protein